MNDATVDVFGALCLVDLDFLLTSADLGENVALGFLLGPRVNAGGRIGQADLGAVLARRDPRRAHPARTAADDEEVVVVVGHRSDSVQRQASAFKPRRAKSKRLLGS